MTEEDVANESDSLKKKKKKTTTTKRRRRKKKSEESEAHGYSYVWSLDVRVVGGSARRRST